MSCLSFFALPIDMAASLRNEITKDRLLRFFPKRILSNLFVSKWFVSNKVGFHMAKTDMKTCANEKEFPLAQHGIWCHCSENRSSNWSFPVSASHSWMQKHIQHPFSNISSQKSFPNLQVKSHSHCWSRNLAELLKRHNAQCGPKHQGRPKQKDVTVGQCRSKLSKKAKTAKHQPMSKVIGNGL